MEYCMIYACKSMILLSMTLTFGSLMFNCDMIIVGDSIRVHLDEIMLSLLELIIISLIVDFNIRILTDDTYCLSDIDCIISSMCGIFIRIVYHRFPYVYYCLHHVQCSIIYCSLLISLIIIISVYEICTKKIMKFISIHFCF